jgi:hypothetical protein
MSRSGCEKDKQRDVVRALAVQDLQLLLGAEPHRAKAFRVLSRRSKSDELRAICKEGVSYTLRRVGRIKEALTKLDAPLVSQPSSGLDGLIKDARRAAIKTKSAETDVAIRAARTNFAFRFAHLYEHRSASSACKSTEGSPRMASVNKRKAGGHRRNEQNGAKAIASPPEEAGEIICRPPPVVRRKVLSFHAVKTDQVGHSGNRWTRVRSRCHQNRP